MASSHRVSPLRHVNTYDAMVSDDPNAAVPNGSANPEKPESPSSPVREAHDSMRGGPDLRDRNGCRAIMGFVGGVFRWLLEASDRLRLQLVEWAHQLPGPGWLAPVAVARSAPPGRSGGAMGTAGLRQRYSARRGGLPGTSPTAEDPTAPGEVPRRVLAIGSGLVWGGKDRRFTWARRSAPRRPATPDRPTTRSG